MNNIQSVKYEQNSINDFLNHCLCNNIEAVEVMIANGIDVNARCSAALETALLFGHLKLAEILIKAGATVNPSTLLKLCDLDRSTEIGLAIKAGADIAFNNYQIVRNLILMEHTESLKVLLENVIDKIILHKVALFASCCFRKEKSLKIIIEDGADVTVDNNEALEIAVISGDSKIVNILIDAGIDVTKANIFILIKHAKLNGYKDIEKILLEEMRNKTKNKS